MTKCSIGQPEGGNKYTVKVEVLPSSKAIHVKVQTADGTGEVSLYFDSLAGLVDFQTLVAKATLMASTSAVVPKE